MISGLYWHVHHDRLIEWCYGCDRRVAYIKSDKPEHEKALRLRLFQPVRGVLPAPLIEAGQACDEARQAYYDKARQAYYEARYAYVEARQAYDEAIELYRTEIEKLHAIECPNCPWDGLTIFNKAVSAAGGK